MSEYRESLRRLQERIAALEEENAELRADLAAKNEEVVAREIDVALAANRAPERRGFGIAALGVVMLAAMGALAFFELRPARGATSVTSAGAPSPNPTPSRIHLKFTGTFVSGRGAGPGDPCTVELDGTLRAKDQAEPQRLLVECNGHIVWSQRGRSLSGIKLPSATVTPSPTEPGGRDLVYAAEDTPVPDGGGKISIDTHLGRVSIERGSLVGSFQSELAFSTPGIPVVDD